MLVTRLIGHFTTVRFHIYVSAKQLKTKLKKLAHYERIFKLFALSVKTLKHYRLELKNNKVSQSIISQSNLIQGR